MNEISRLQDEINRLNRLISTINPVDQLNIEHLRKKVAEYSTELSVAKRKQWEETHERLDYGDER